MVSHNRVGWGEETVVRERTELGYGEASGASVGCDTGAKSIFIKIYVGSVH